MGDSTDDSKKKTAKRLIRLRRNVGEHQVGQTFHVNDDDIAKLGFKPEDHETVEKD